MKSLLFFSAAALALTLAACAPPDGERIGSSAQAITVCAGATTLDGLDVSHYDNDLDWPKIAASGRSFSVVKATEGLTFVDPKFATNWPAMKDAGVVRSAYHFFHSNDDPIAQADHFLATMGKLAPGDLPPSLDLEVTDGQSAETITSTTIAWLDHVAQATGVKPILYTSPSFVTDSMGNPAGLEDHAVLWVAHWQVKCPDVPAPFTTWAFWQTGSGTVPGDDAGPADVDVFNGSKKDLAALTVQAPEEGGGGSGGGKSATASSSASSAASTGAGGSPETTTPSSTDDDSGCSCKTANGGEPTPAAVAWLLALAAFYRRRR